MNLNYIDVSKCLRKEKEVVEGFCLSYDLVRGVCLETMKICDVSVENHENPEE